MSASVLPALVNAEEAHRSLPMPPWLYGAIAFGGFLIGLGVLWTFRNTGAKVPDRHRPNDAEHHG